MEDRDDVVKWRSIAAALHSGALDYCDVFKTTEVITYLYRYQDQRHESTALRRHHDIYYHPDNLHGPTGLSKFFCSKAVDQCLLCRSIRVTVDPAGKFKYKNFVTGKAIMKVVPDDQLNLQRLEHLAVMHTPYFVMLFLGLVQNKRYSFHKTNVSRYSIASYVFEQLREDETSVFRQDAGAFKFLQLWWRFQDRCGSRELTIPIPSFLELHSDRNTWNPRIDTFVNRKTDPLYSFLRRHCLCHELWPGGAAMYDDDMDMSPNMKMITEGEVSTSSLNVLIPRLHVEDILHSVVRLCNARPSRKVSVGNMKCSSMLEPRLDCLVLEDVGHEKAVMLHVVTTLDSGWLPLSSWMTSVRGKFPDEGMIHKVLLGVMGSLRDMCLQDMRPPRHLYTASDTACREPTLATVFFVHSVMGDVLSLLRLLVSVSRLYRSSNITKDEDTFRLTCTNLALCILYTHVEGLDAVLYKQQALLKTWETGDPSSSLPLIHDRLHMTSDIANICYMFCRTGLVNDNMWSQLKPDEAGLRASNVDMPHVWLGEDSRSSETLTSKLLTLGARKPLCVTVIESLREEESNAIRMTQPFTTQPEVCQGLLRVLTVEKKVTPGWTSMAYTLYSGSGYHKNKRSMLNPGVSAHDTETALKYIREDVMKLRKLNGSTAIASGPSGSSSVVSGAEMIDLVYPDNHVVNNQGDSIHPQGDILTDLNLTANTIDLNFTANRSIGSGLIQEGLLTPRNTDDMNAFILQSGHKMDCEGVGTPSDINEFYTNTPMQESCSSLDVSSMLFNCFKGQYKDDPQTLNRLVTEILRNEIMENLKGQTETPSGSQNSCLHKQPTQAQHQDTVQQVYATIEPYQIMQQPMEAFELENISVEPLEDPQEDRSPTVDEVVILKQNPRWRSIGVPITTGKWYKMSYVICESITNQSRLKDITIQHIPSHKGPVSNPCEDMTMMKVVCEESNKPMGCILRKDPNNHTTSWSLGVESHLKHHCVLKYPRNLIYNKQLCNMEQADRVYRTVDLSAPPCGKGFQQSVNTQL